MSNPYIALQSEIFRSVVDLGKLPHPTSRKFTAEKWVDALSALSEPSQRDIDLCASALFFGKEIASLRKTYEADLFVGLDKRTATLLAVASANENQIILSKKVETEARNQKRKAKVARLDDFGKIKISSRYEGNVASPDTVAAKIVDTLPHMLERTNRLPDKSEQGIGDLWQKGARISSILSIENGLRDLWQHALWEGWRLKKDNGDWKYEPCDKHMAELWHVWTRRQEGLATQGSMLDQINNQMAGNFRFDTKSYLKKTVVGIGTSKGMRSFKLGAQSGYVFGQIKHVLEHTVLTESYLVDFLETPLPREELCGLSCMDLQRVWCLIRDAAGVLVSKIARKPSSELQGIEQRALLVSTCSLEKAIAECCDITAEQVHAAVTFLSLGASDVRGMFDEGFWSRPILKVDDDSVAIVMTSVDVGSPIRRAEHWLSRAGFSDDLSNAKRGESFERVVRQKLSSAIAENPILINSHCYLHDLKRGGEKGEQIDLLLKLKNTVVVGEIKCWLGPAEAIEYFSYLKKLSKAAEQVERKLRWAQENPEAVAGCLNVSPDDVKSMRFLPIVVTNQGYGFSLQLSGVSIVDFHFLRLYLSKGKYTAGMAFDRKKGAAVPFKENLYSTESEAELNLIPAISKPVPLKRYLDAIEWFESRLPTSSGRDLRILNCNLGKNISPVSDEEILQLLPQSSGRG